MISSMEHKCQRGNEIISPKKCFSRKLLILKVDFRKDLRYFELGFSSPCYGTNVVRIEIQIMDSGLPACVSDCTAVGDRLVLPRQPSDRRKIWTAASRHIILQSERRDRSSEAPVRSSNLSKLAAFPGKRIRPVGSYPRPKWGRDSWSGTTKESESRRRSVGCEDEKVRKCLGNETAHVLLDEIQVEESLSCVESPTAVLRLRIKECSAEKDQGQLRKESEWVRVQEAEMLEKYRDFSQIDFGDEIRDCAAVGDRLVLPRQPSDRREIWTTASRLIFLQSDRRDRSSEAPVRSNNLSKLASFPGKRIR
ncbi:hypothetical protein OSB04_015758 [Centaurea solstitialis]|uniref:Uncharacterized protein n=1 Tax=Centaurea solstitialis TaxID=347529 RepID=A0AA38SZT1_9ASTR|nr:hypothetical protein OSB04_015758 [Centaurea solstitialis]